MSNVAFAVWHEGIPEAETPTGPQKQGRWVIAIDGERFLLSNDEGVFYWQDMADCTMFRVHTPDVPIPVVPLQMQQQAPQIVQANGPLPRAERRAQAFGR